MAFDRVSGGRLEYGIGLGNTAGDFAKYGVDREEARDRFEEAGEIIVNAWTHERFSHQGRFWQYEDVALYPRPVQQPHPPLWVAGHSPESFGWAGRHGANVMTVAHPYPPEQYTSGLAAWRAGLTEVGIDPAQRHCKLHLRVFVDENGERAREIAEAGIRRYDQIASIGRPGRPAEPPGGYNWTEMLARGRNVYGTPDQCIAAIKNSIANYDFDVFSTTFFYGGIPHDAVLRSMSLFAREVMPAFTE